MSNLLVTATFMTAVGGLAFDGELPKATDAVVSTPTFQPPEVTIPPSIHELARRQNGQTVLWGPDNTCGAAYNCNGPDVTCVLVTTSAVGAVACCNGDDCGLRFGCVDYRDIYYSSSCDNGCFQDTFTVKCTNSATPYCGTVTFFDGIVDYYCDTLSISTPQQLYTTYNGETDGRSFTEVVVTLSSDSTATRPDPSPNTDNGDAPTATGTSPLSSSSGSSGGISSGSPGSSGASGPSTNVGAIAGGAVGGVAVIALIAFGIWFLVHHSKKEKNGGAVPEPGPPPQMQHDGPPPSTGYQQPYNNNNNAHYSQQYPPPPQGSSSPAQGYYFSEQKPGGFVALAPAPTPGDGNGSASPGSQSADSRQGVLPTSPASTAGSWRQPVHQTPPPPNVHPTVHEAGGNAVGERDYNSNHREQFHELGP